MSAYVLCFCSIITGEPILYDMHLFFIYTKCYKYPYSMRQKDELTIGSPRRKNATGSFNQQQFSHTGENTYNTLVFALRDAALLLDICIFRVWTNRYGAHTCGVYTYIKKSKTNQPTQLRCISCRTDQNIVQFCLGIQYSYVTTTDDTEKRNFARLTVPSLPTIAIIYVYTWSFVVERSSKSPFSSSSSSSASVCGFFFVFKYLETHKCVFYLLT